MAYNELIKHFQKVRDYMHEFYIYGFRSRLDLSYKSHRSYDNERRRIESYFKDYLSFQYSGSKNIYFSIDNRHLSHNPLYKAFQSKSFTDKSISLHFIILDILYDSSIQLSLKDIIVQIDDYLSQFELPIHYDESTIRKKLNEYINLGIIESQKINNQFIYHRVESFPLDSYYDAIAYFSEADVLGVIGSFLLHNESYNLFRFKHHYITHAIDSEIIEQLFEAMKKKIFITITNHNPKSHKESNIKMVPIKIFMSSQTGRAHLLAYVPHYHSFKTLRIDYIKEIVMQEKCLDFELLRNQLLEIQKHMWGVMYIPHHIEHVEFVVYVEKYEHYIYDRLLREKRIGTVTPIDEHHIRFEADIYDSFEILPWVRTFICRIVQLNFSNRTVENRLKDDILKMYEMYEIGDDA